MKKNTDIKTIDGFGKEWHQFDQTGLSEYEIRSMFQKYFKVFPWHLVPKTACGFDMGCGSGRWAKIVSTKVGVLHCIDPSSAIDVAKRNLADSPNCYFHKCSVHQNVLPKKSMDFGYSLGVLHHVPDPYEGIKSCVRMLKPGAPFLVYLYYAFDNRRAYYKVIWRLSNFLRILISRLPYRPRYLLSQGLALLVYFPLARLIFFLEKIGLKSNFIEQLPLAYYRKLSFYTMRTDALDRFGTRLEHRFSKKQIVQMLENAGLENIEFSDSAPFWCAVGIKKK